MWFSEYKWILLGLKETDQYWLLRQSYNGYIRVMMLTFVINSAW